MERTTIDLALPILFVVSAIIFGPLSAWLAIARERSATIWFAYGLLLGPIAPLLIAAAPPGRCRVCGEQSRGWQLRCDWCGAAIDGSERPAQIVLGPGRPAVLPDAASTGGAGRSGVNLAAVGAVSAASMNAPPSASTANGQAYDSATRGSSDTEILATGVFVGGSVHLSLGARYAIARRKRTFEVLGPVDIAPGVLRLEHPMAGLDATVVADRLVVTEKTTGRPTFVIVFQSLTVQDGVDLESAFGARRRTPRRAIG
ncbi:MAG: hypothetical protein M3P84_09720 [Chloroflexota bacterium]|nr:hypothetical protein [Chloroflexota bacterium]